MVFLVSVLEAPLILLGGYFFPVPWLALSLLSLKRTDNQDRHLSMPAASVLINQLEPKGIWGINSAYLFPLFSTFLQPEGECRNINPLLCPRSKISGQSTNLSSFIFSL